MQEIPNTSSRRLHYLHYASQKGELKAFNETNWMAVVYSKTFKAKTQAGTLSEILNLKPLFIYCVAANFTDMEDEVVEQLCELWGEPDEDAEGYPLTFGDNHLREAILFSLVSAFHDTKSIDQVVVIDLNEEALSDAEKQEAFPGN